MKLTITLDGPAAPQILRSIARSYALLSIHSRLTDARGTAKAPWFRVAVAHGAGIMDAHRRWMRTVDRERVSYRAALASVLGEARVPDAPTIEWRSYRSPCGKVFPVSYNATVATAAAREYAEAVVKLAMAPSEGAAR